MPAERQAMRSQWQYVLQLARSIWAMSASSTSAGHHACTKGSVPVAGTRPYCQPSSVQTIPAQKWQSSGSSWPCTAWFLPLAMLPVVAHAERDPTPEAHRWSLLGLEHRRRLFFKYEKRIRDNSSLEKVFDYFSSKEEQGGDKYMTPFDLLAAIVPTYPPSQSQQTRSGSLDGEPSSRMPKHEEQLQRACTGIFKKFDVDGDGKLSFWEYRLVLTLLAIPEVDAAVIFNAVDLDGSGAIDAAEFQEVISLLQGSTSTRRAPKARVGRGLHRKPTVVSGLLVSFFGPDQDGKLTLQQFIDFLQQLHEEVIMLEFMYYDVEHTGSIPGIDFARSLVSAADIRMVDKLMDQVEGLSDELKAARFTQQDFNTMVGLARKSHGLEVALNFYDQVGRPVTRNDLDKLLRKLCGVSLSAHVLDLVMALFSDSTGFLDVQLFITMLERRAKLWSNCNKAHHETPSEGMSKLWNCVKQCTIPDA